MFARDGERFNIPGNFGSWPVAPVGRTKERTQTDSNQGVRLEIIAENRSKLEKWSRSNHSVAGTRTLPKITPLATLLSKLHSNYLGVGSDLVKGYDSKPLQQVNARTTIHT